MTQLTGGVFFDCVVIKYTLLSTANTSVVVETKGEPKWASGQVIQQGEGPGSELPVKIRVFSASQRLFQGVKQPVEITETLPDPLQDAINTQHKSRSSFTSGPLRSLCDLPIRFSLFVCYLAETISARLAPLLSR